MAKHDPLHVHVPESLILKLKAEVQEDLDADASLTAEFVWALGGDPKCFRRFLIARKLDVNAAAAMIRATLRYREALEPIAPETKRIVAPLWPGAWCGRSVDGHPLSIFKVGSIKMRNVLALVTEEQFACYYT